MSKRVLASALTVFIIAPFHVCGQTAPPPSDATPPSGATRSTSGTTTTANTPAPPQEPYILEDGGFSIEPFYWLNRAQPSLFGGKTATTFGNLDYPGNANYSVGGEIAFPAGRSNSLRISYFRGQGNANSTLSQNANIFSENYSAGDYLSANYLIQGAKVSWDYLSYTWHKRAGAIRLKTLWEVQYVNVGTNIIAPLKEATTDTSSGSTDFNTAQGAKNLILPTLGLGFEQRIGHHFRWELKGSGFGIPHRSDIWDAEGSIAIRVRQFEILGGEKAFHFKTTPQADQYFTDTLSGAYVGLRYYWGGAE